MERPRVLLEEWLPAQAVGIECMRESSVGHHPPPNRLHVWWARRPLTISRAAVLGSLLPADFDRDSFERLLGFGAPSAEIKRLRAIMDTGIRLGGYGFDRAFQGHVPEPDLHKARHAIQCLWDGSAVVIDPMAGGGSIPLEAARLGLEALANELNPVACSIEEVTIDYPFRFGQSLLKPARRWGEVWWQRFVEKMSPFFPDEGFAVPDGYLFARTVPCPDTGHPTPLLPFWSLSKVSGESHIVANPVQIDEETGDWTIEVRTVGNRAGQLPEPPQRTYYRGDGWSLFTGSEMPSDYIKAMAQQGEMGYRLYAVATKANELRFRPPEPRDFRALEAAERELERLRPRWEEENVIPTEEYPEASSDMRPRLYGMPRWADFFTHRQLLAAGVLVEELRDLRPQIAAREGEEIADGVVHLLSLALDKFISYNCIASKWERTRTVIKGKFDRHDFSFRPAFAELAACVSGAGLDWAIDNALDAYEKLCQLPAAPDARPATIMQGSADSLWDLDDQSVTAVVVDPPYADNVQYAELADFFYVWLKRTQGYRRPEWFSTYLTGKEKEAVVNLTRHRDDDQERGQARRQASRFYQNLMTDSFAEARRVLRDDGVLTVMFTHKKQSAWANLFRALIEAGFTVSATWPVMTESRHSLHQANKNSARSTVLLVARKRQRDARGYWDDAMRAEIRQAAQEAAARLRQQGLNAVDQLVGAFGPAMEVFTRYPEVRYDTGEPVDVREAIQCAADAVVDWREDRAAARGLEEMDPESRFYWLCWDVLAARQVRFNEAMLLGRSVGMDVDNLFRAGLLNKSGNYVEFRSAEERRRDKPVRNVQEQMELELTKSGRKRKRYRRKVHPDDEVFQSAIDMCHAMALRYLEGGGGQAGIGSAAGKARQQGWDDDSPCARLMEALVQAAPQAVRFPSETRQKNAADHLPEFRAWHAMLESVFGIEAPEWTPERDPQMELDLD